MDRGLSREPAAEDAVDSSEKFLNQWTSLVSTTNWEKGRIICEWREALKAGGARTKQFSDEVWSQQVGNVTAQHVGRLRRVYERFGTSRDSYAGLFWSHFQAALEWSDAEMWLEGAVQTTWSVAQMRRKRWETLGNVDEPEPSDVDIVSAEVDEDGPTAEESASMEVGDDAPGKNRSTSVRDLDEANAALEESDEESEGEGDVEGSYDDDASAEKPASVRPFDNLPDMPEDLAEAFESFKLGILRHKLAGWTEIGRDDMLATLDALKQLVTAP